MNVLPIFVQWLAHDDLDLDLDLLEKYSFELEGITKGVILSNIGGWQSEIIRVEDFKYKPLIDAISKKIDDMSIHLHLNKKLVLEDIWININRNVDFNRSHRHPGALVSGVFYVKVSPNSGIIRFKNPHASTQEMYYKYSNVDKVIDYSNAANSLDFHIRPYNNLLIMFPGWLDHEVESNLSPDDIRISIAFNASTL
jgi:uncharacterized protein (TIGR02466 family)